MARISNLKLFLISTFALSILLESTAYADTYNLYFKKQNDQKLESSAIIEEPEENSTPVKEAAPDSLKTTIPPQAGPTNIIINNNITQPKESVSEPAKEPESSPEFQPVVSQPEEVKRRKAFLQTSIGVAYLSRSDLYMSSRFDYPEAAFTMGLRFNVGPAIALAGWGGITKNQYARFYGGGDFEFIPLRVDGGRFDVFELGVLAGASTLSRQASGKHPLHLGARMSLNLNESTGLTSALRFGDRHLMFELGIVTAL